jgi:tetratricopeptide (TPR) repeat protein
MGQWTKSFLRIGIDHRILRFNSLAIFGMKNHNLLVSCLAFICLFILEPCYSQDESAYLNNIDEAVSSGDTTDIIRAWYALGKFYDNNQQFAKSTDALKNALYWADRQGNNRASAAVSNYFASVFSQKGESDSAVFYFRKAVNAFSKVPDSAKMAYAMINLGDELASKGWFVEAAEFGLQAVRIKESTQDSSNLAYVYQKVGEIFKLSGENEQWESYVKKAYSLIHMADYANLSAVISIYNDLGGIAEIYGDFDRALQYYDTLIHIAKENDHSAAIGVALSNCAIIHKKMGDLQKALDTALESNIYEKHSVYHGITGRNLLAELYLDLGDFEQARYFADLAFKDSKIDNFPEEKMRSVRLFYQMDKELGDFEKALFWMELYKELSDLIRDKELRASVLDMELAYQTEKKEARIELLTAENMIKSQRLRIGIIVLLVMLVMMALILYIFQMKRKQSQYIENDLQQKVLRAQMNPHFIFNVLSSIQYFMLANDAKKASGYLSSLALLMRSILDFSASETITLEKELAMLKSYVALEQMRMPDRFSFQLQADNLTDNDVILIPPMLIQPFLENAIKHGFQGIGYHGNLSLSVTDLNDRVVFVIEDNGVGLKDQSESKVSHRSMAMQIFEARRKLIAGKYKKSFGFEMINMRDANPGLSGVRVVISVPVLNSSNK